MPGIVCHLVVVTVTAKLCFAFQKCQLLNRNSSHAKQSPLSPFNEVCIMLYLYPNNNLPLARFLEVSKQSDWQTKVLTTLSFPTFMTIFISTISASFNYMEHVYGTLGQNIF